MKMNEIRKIAKKFMSKKYVWANGQSAAVYSDSPNPPDEYCYDRRDNNLTIKDAVKMAMKFFEKKSENFLD